MSKEPELKPCPFCGDESISDYGSAGIGTIRRFWNCDNCGCQGPHTLMRPPETVEEANARAAEKWNERIDSDTALIGELVERIDYLESEAKRFAADYPQSSDGRNTFLIFADKIAALPVLTRARKRTGGA